uniref:Ribosomal protein S21 n=1 Tax=Dunaliella tertiolecta TaxID=3047 RepID=A0A7S3QKF1_DUNTE|mmetsp:Transcript_10504/g.28735  ORF Transcript_10504/g.28735 Transcript_10504/m.28735 type:complete len:235 (+) Transcript_10504:33-737(+)
MALLSQSKTLAGSRAFSGLRARVSPVVSNGSRVTMKRKDSYMVEVNVGEDEPEDIAVRKFMKKVMESGVIEELRNRRYKETPLQEWKRRTRERIAKNKMGIRMPTWEEEYGIDPEVKPFDEFYQRDPEVAASFVDGFMQYQLDNGGYMDSAWGQNMAGGYIQSMGGYMSPDQTGGYAQAGGAYMAGAQDAGAYGGYAAPAVDAYGNPITYADPAYIPQPEGYQQPIYNPPPQQQ